MFAEKTTLNREDAQLAQDIIKEIDSKEHAHAKDMAAHIVIGRISGDVKVTMAEETIRSIVPKHLYCQSQVLSHIIHDSIWPLPNKQYNFPEESKLTEAAAGLFNTVLRKMEKSYQPRMEQLWRHLDGQDAHYDAFLICNRYPKHIYSKVQRLALNLRDYLNMLQIDSRCVVKIYEDGE